MLARVVPPSGPALGGAGLALRGELPVQAIKHGVGTVVGTQSQNPASRMFDHAPSLEHDLLHHRLHAPPLGRMAQWRVFANERILTLPTAGCEDAAAMSGAACRERSCQFQGRRHPGLLAGSGAGPNPSGSSPGDAKSQGAVVCNVQQTQGQTTALNSRVRHQVKQVIDLYRASFKLATTTGPTERLGSVF